MADASWTITHLTSEDTVEEAMEALYVASEAPPPVPVINEARGRVKDSLVKINRGPNFCAAYKVSSSHDDSKLSKGIRIAEICCGPFSLLGTYTESFNGTKDDSVVAELR